MNNYYQKYIKYKTKYLKLKGGQFDKELQNQIKNEVYENKSKKNNPTFFITYGPPASGKGGIMKKVIDEENKEIIDVSEKKSDEQIVKVDVDSIIGKHPEFDKERKELLKHKKKLLERKMELFKKLENLDSELELKSLDSELEKTNKNLQNLYMKYRTEESTDTMKGDDLSDEITKGALEKRLDIAWETTGYSVDWTIDKIIPMVKSAGYKIVVVYPLVPVDIAIDRAHEREKTTGQTPAPESYIRDIARNAADNIKKLKADVNTIYIYDNSGEMGEEKLLVKYESSVDCLGTNNEKTKFIEEVQTMIKGFCKN